MTQLVRRADLPVQQAVNTQVARHMERIQETAELATFTMEEMSNTYGYADYKARTTLAAAEALRQISPHPESALGKQAEVSNQLRWQHYMQQMDHLATHAGADMLAKFAAGSAGAPVQARGVLDRLLGG